MTSSAVFSVALIARIGSCCTIVLFCSKIDGKEGLKGLKNTPLCTGKDLVRWTVEKG
jgi:hypothetical protein